MPRSARSACAAPDKLMVVAHPDDEALFGGQELLRTPGWLVLCMTHGDNPQRRQHFAQALELAAAHGVQWAYPDRPGRSRQPEAARADWTPYLPQMRTRLLALYRRHTFSKVVTHGQAGEYGHEHHRMVHQLVTRTLPTSEIRCFCVGEPIEPSLLERKLVLLAVYKEQITHREREKYAQWVYCAATRAYTLQTGTDDEPS
ncbi:MAG: PIG-L family deacetylase [Myxococcota bacterium]